MDRNYIENFYLEPGLWTHFYLKILHGSFDFFIIGTGFYKLSNNEEYNE